MASMIPSANLSSPDPLRISRVVIAICTCRRTGLLEKLLVHLAGAPLGNVERCEISILVVDNAPTGEVADMIERIRERLPLTIELVEEPEPGISQARNRAVQEALRRNCDFLAFIDDDDLPATDWLDRLLERQVRSAADIVLGRIVRRKADGSEVILNDDETIWREDGLANALGTGNVLIAGTLLKKMRDLGAVFDPAFGSTGGEDADFYYRAKLAGARFVREPASHVFAPYTEERLRGRGLFALKFRYGCADAALVRRHLDPAARRKWLFATGRRFLRSLLSTPWRLVRSPTKADRTLSKLGWPSGALFGFFGGRYGYYGKKVR
ncbi:MAG: glycosyltransferase family 2 protein [Geminicoccaceae bacterium]